MTSDAQRQMHKVVKIANIRKQRLANAAADAAREVIAAQARVAEAAAIVEAAQAELDGAGFTFSNNPASDQLLIWRDRCSAVKTKKIEAHVICVTEQDEADSALSQTMRALQRQNLRHDHLADLAQRQRHAVRRVHEARVDDEQQGSGQKLPNPHDGHKLI
jgi:hypothetical protein